MDTKLAPLRLQVVENDEDDRDVLREVLETLPCAVTYFNSSTELLEQLATESTPAEFRVFLVDMNMASPNGVELTRQICQRQSLRNSPVIVYSTSSDLVDADACYQAGASAYLTKPAHFDDWKTLLTTLVEFWRCVHPGSGSKV